ncbi:MAG: hypothetical protein NDJ90_03705 [Oligoflexia bacterium]|nr:hypothetical protein [Oligoflexia bacterium]
MEIPVLKAEHFEVKARPDLGAKRVTLLVSGTLDESIKLRAVSTYLFNSQGDFGELVVDLAGLAGISSAGVREWISFLALVGEAGLRLSFSSLSEIFLERANLFPDLLGRPRATVSVVAAPYYCAKCDDRRTFELRVAELRFAGPEPVLPSHSCAQCGGALEFDEIASDYFKLFRSL